MAEQTSSDIVVDAPAAEVMSVIADFGAYPEWATGVKQCTPVQMGDGGRAEQVRFVLDATPIRDEYVLAYTWDGDRSVSWTLAEGRMLKAMDGAYLLDELPGGATRVTYRLSVDVAMPLLGMLKRKAERVIVDTALSGLKKRVERG